MKLKILNNEKMNKPNKRRENRTGFYDSIYGYITVNFLRGLIHNDFNLNSKEFKNYRQIVEFMNKILKINKINHAFKENYIAQLKKKKEVVYLKKYHGLGRLKFLLIMLKEDSLILTKRNF